MRAIGITGSIATGKSTLLGAFEKAGIPVFSADAAVAKLYSGAAVAPVEALFPGVTVNGQIDRQALAKKLAVDPSGFARLEALVHPMVRQEIAQFLATSKAAGFPAAAVEVPLLFESGHDYGFDAIAVTHVDEATQNQRIMARPGMTVEKRDALLARQLPQADKMKRATWLFDTSRPPEEIEERVRALLDDIVAGREPK
jgi:dephospho-CoA kinase